MKAEEASAETATTASQQQRMEAIWRDRAKRLSQHVVAVGTRQGALPVIVLGVGQECYGIDLPDVAEILPPVQATPVPGASPVFAGVINVHGEIRPVIDLRRLLGIDTPRSGGQSRVILLRRLDREMGLQIDSVEQILWVGKEDLQETWNRDAESSPHVKGLTKDQLILLRTEALFAELHRGEAT